LPAGDLSWVEKKITMTLNENEPLHRIVLLTALYSDGVF
jgi:hypothetical protein